MSCKKELWYSDCYFQHQSSAAWPSAFSSFHVHFIWRGERGGASFMRSEIVHESSTSLGLLPSISMHPPYADRDENMQQPWSFNMEQTPVVSKWCAKFVGIFSRPHPGRSNQRCWIHYYIKAAKKIITPNHHVLLFSIFQWAFEWEKSTQSFGASGWITCKRATKLLSLVATMLAMEYSCLQKPLSVSHIWNLCLGLIRFSRLKHKNEGKISRYCKEDFMSSQR